MSEFTDDLIGADAYTAGAPPKREFLPWHLPRKQFVRRTQWVKLTEELVNADGRSSAEPLRYLGLPGTDLIDLRCLAQDVCAPLGCSLRFLGFNSAAQPGSSAHTDLNVSREELASLVPIDVQSTVRPDDFRTLGSESSLAWKAALDIGPFDVVNLDLCDGLIVDSPGDLGSIYAAITRLFGLQQRRTRPWLMLLTMRVGHDHVDPEAFERLLDSVRHNLDDCEGFSSECERHLGFDNLAAPWAGWNAARMLDVSSCAVVKWLLRLAAGGNATVDLRSTQSYAVGGDLEVDDLVSFALTIKPVPVPANDPSGLAPNLEASLDECAAAKRFPARLAKRVLVDEVLRENATIASQYADESERLLRAARYDTSGYAEWISTRT